MDVKNLEENQDLFKDIQRRVQSPGKEMISSTSLKSRGDLVGKIAIFNYKFRSYCVVIVRTKRAPKGTFKARTTPNDILTTFHLDQYTLHPRDIDEIVDRVYNIRTKKGKQLLVRYIRRKKGPFLSLLSEFISNIFRLIFRGRLAIMRNNFKTFIVSSITNCRLLK